MENIKLIETNKTDKIFQDVKDLFLEAFPKDELPDYIESDEPIEYQKLYAVFDDDEFIATTSLFEEIDNYIYIVYLAVKSSMRGKGYGSKILKIIKDKFKGNTILLSIESPNVECTNLEQRILRKRMYERNGFITIGEDFDTEVCGVMQLMANNSLETPEHLWENIKPVIENVTKMIE